MYQCWYLTLGIPPEIWETGLHDQSGRVRVSWIGTHPSPPKTPRESNRDKPHWCWFGSIRGSWKRLHSLSLFNPLKSYANS
ncbi:hypothetical protein AFLA_001063 [Aspergillus flavus NRRL3357]|nr:hypothetical protein AFLA_001063 [Aspergillus flavus NRRL3357]